VDDNAKFQYPNQLSTGMNSQEQIVRETVQFILEKYTSGIKIDKAIETHRTISVTEQDIIESMSAKLPYCVADEVLYFLLAIHDQITSSYKCLLSAEESIPMFRLFPFSLVLPMSFLIDDLKRWTSMEKYVDLFMGEHCFFRTPRLNQRSECAPIYCCRQDVDDYDSSGITCYSNLTNLLLMIAECYETGAYYYDKSNAFATWKEDLNRSEVIFRKYHPGLPFRSPNELDHFFVKHF
jgi:hypothetical protein